VSAAKLYTPEVLALAAGLAEWPFDAAMAWSGAARSPSCGSTLMLSLDTDAAGRIDRIGLRAQACAIGQASAAIFARGAIGTSRADIARAAEAVAAWLSGGAALPDWPGLEAIAAAASFPGRHGAILLPWKAALDALPTSDADG
jgi:NifU-like protein involved in Fe-S cluster formation